MANLRPIAMVICESVEPPLDDKLTFLSESEKDSYLSHAVGLSKKRRTARVTLQRANAINRNKRWYGGNHLFPVLKQPRILDFLKSSGIPAENGHPLDANPTRQITIDPSNVVAYNFAPYIDGDLIKAYVQGSNLPIGQAFDEDLGDGKLPAWSFRGTGTIVQNGSRAEVQSITAVCWDRVFYPSHPEAYTDYVMNESGILLPDYYDWKTPKPETTQKIQECGIIQPLMSDDVRSYIKEKCSTLKMVKESFDLYYDDISITEAGFIQLTDKQYGHVYIIPMEQQLHNEMLAYAQSKL